MNGARDANESPFQMPPLPLSGGELELPRRGLVGTGNLRRC